MNKISWKYYNPVNKNLLKVRKMSLEPSRPKPVQSQQNNVRTTFIERYSNVIFLTLNRFWSVLTIFC